MEFLDQAVQFSSQNLLAVSGIAAIVVEIVLRLVPSEKPVGIIIATSAALKKCAQISTNVSAFLDKLVPQNLKK